MTVMLNFVHILVICLPLAGFGVVLLMTFRLNKRWRSQMEEKDLQLCDKTKEYDESRLALVSLLTLFAVSLHANEKNTAIIEHLRDLLKHAESEYNRIRIESALAAGEAAASKVYRDALRCHVAVLLQEKASREATEKAIAAIKGYFGGLGGSNA